MIINSDISYTLIRKSFLRYRRIKITSDGSIIVTVNRTCGKKDIKKFIEEKKNWINKTVNRLMQKKQGNESLVIEKKGQLLHCGQWYRIKTTEADEAVKKIYINEADRIISLSLNNENEGLKDKLDNWQKEVFKKTVEALAGRIGRANGIEYNCIIVRGQKSRWGCCSSKNNISLNWRLIKAPAHILEYVVIHELCHIRERSHSGRFWSIVGSLYPGYKEAKKWLRDNGELLYLEC